MAGGIDVKMGVSGIAQFKSAMNQAQQSVKTLDAQLKLNEKQFQATGDKETYMANKSKLLQQQMNAQNKVIKEGQNALQAMEKQGIDPASQAYQKMQQNVVNAQAALLDMNSDLNSVGQSASDTAQKTDKLTNSLNGINKKVSFDAVLNGIGEVTSGMESAARRVEAIVTDVWSTMVQAATWAESETNLAAMYGIDVETLQKMQGAADVIGTSVDSMINSQQRLKNNLVYGGKDFQEAIKELGVNLKAGGEWWKNNEGASGAAVRERMAAAMQMRDFEDIFWDIGDALLHYDDAIERDAMANKIFGKSWMDLMPLFKSGREKYEEAFAESAAVSQENIDKLNELQTTLQRLDQEYQKTKYTILSELAPAFNEVGTTVKDLIQQFNEYLETPEGQEKLSELSEAVTNLFTGLSDTDFSNALDTAKTILDSITGALGWIMQNHKLVEDAIKGIGGAFLTLKVAEVVGTLAQGAAALKNLLGGGGAAAAGTGSATIVATTKEPTLLDILGIGALLKTAKEASEELRTGLWGYWNGTNKKQIVGTLTPVMPGEPRRTRNITGTASEESMQGLIIERTVENIYDDLYQAINDYDPNTNAQDTVEFFNNVLYPLIEEAGKGSGVVGDSINEIADLIYDKWRQSLFDDEWEGTTGGLLNILQEAIDEKAQGLKVETTPELTEDAATILQNQANGLSIKVRTIPDLSSIDGSNANGLPFVPFDGYIAALHKGERVVPANQNKNYNNTSNVYFDRVNVNSGIDADGLAAKIAETTKHTLAGFGG